MNERIILRSDLDNAGDPERLMKFRLFYEGALSSQSRRPEPNQHDSKADHKHEVRLAFSRQLEHLWETMPSLKAWQTWGEIFGSPRGEKIPMVEAIYRNQPELGGQRFIPLVNEEFCLLCRLDILLLRRDKPGSIFTSRDIDNRLKIIFDALSCPQSANQLGKKGMENPPENGKVFVLAKDDSLFSHVSVETDELLAPPHGCDESYSRVIITVDISVYRPIAINFGVF